jgi:hypothetical protein
MILALSSLAIVFPVTAFTLAIDADIADATPNLHCTDKGASIVARVVQCTPRASAVALTLGVWAAVPAFLFLTS